MRVFVYVTIISLLIGYVLAASVPASRASRGVKKPTKQDGGDHSTRVQGLAKTKLKAKVKSTHKQQEGESEEPSAFNRGSHLGENPDEFLEQFGYLPTPRGGDRQHSPEARREAILNFQRMTGMRETGVLDRATQEKMASPRCGMPDMMPDDAEIPAGVARDPSGDGVDNPVGYYVPGYKWSKTSLTWRTQNYSPDMSQSGQRRAFYNAFKYWSDITPLTFRESSGSNVDIDIKFAQPGRDHGDGYGNAFDGQGGTLAHAFYPESGDTHFDEGETWTENEDRGTNLEIVAAHEFGHALGLGHSNIPDALMAPYYQGYIPNYKLHTDDIRGIQSIYGGKSRPEVTTTTRRPDRPTPRPTSPPKGKPDTCEGRFDDLYQDGDGRIYALSGKWVFRMGYWEMDEDFPKQTRKYYRDTPPYSAAATVHSFRTRYTYFFKGKKVVQYYGDRKIRRKTITGSGFQAPQSAIMPRDGRIYLLRGDYYWLFDESTLNIVPGSKARIDSRWPGLPGNITAAVRLSDGYLYFFKGAKYRKYDESRRQVVTGYPKLTAGPWIGPKCTRDGRYIQK